MKESDERYTPEEVMEPLVQVFGEMFDPCPRESKFDGLNVPWLTKNFVNPPYSNIKQWAEEAVAEARHGKFIAFLAPNDCSTGWYRLLKANSWGVWYIPFRVKFDSPDGRKRDVARSHVCFFLGGLK